MAKRINYYLCILVTVLCFGCSKKDNVMAQLPAPVAGAKSTADNSEEKKDEEMKKEIYMAVGDNKLTVKLVDNNATKALVEALSEAPITFEANDYGGFEKVGALGRSLPTSNTQLTTKPGDVILYNGNQIVLFYGSNSWSYTRLGEMQYQSTDELKNFLRAGQGSIKVTLSLE